MGQNARLLLLTAWFLVFAVSSFLVVASSKIEFTDGLSTAFESNTERFQNYKVFQDKFDTSTADLFILLDGVDFAEAENHTKVGEYLTELQFIDGVETVISPFSFTIKDSSGNEDFVYPSTPLSSADMAARIDLAKSQNARFKNFLSQNRDHLLIALPIDNYPATNQQQRDLIEEIRSLAVETLDNPKINVAVSGYPVIRTETVSVLFSEFWFLNAFGGIVGTIVAIFAIGSISLGLVTTLSGGTALLWAAGTMTLMGFQVNVITVSLPALILILSFAEAIHLVLEIRRLHLDANPNPIKNAVIRIFPAAGLAAVTTAIALGSLMLSPSVLIYQLGYAGFFAALISTMTVFIIVPLIFYTVHQTVGMGKICKAKNDSNIRNLSLNFLMEWARKAPKAVSIIGIAVFALTVTLYSLMPQVYSIHEGLRPNSEKMITLNKIEDNLAPIGSFHFEHPIKPYKKFESATQALQEIVNPNDVYSLYSLLDKSGPEFEKAVAQLPEQARSRFISADGESSLITMTYRYTDAQSTRDYVTTLEQKIKTIPELANLSNPTGTLAVSSFVTQEMLSAFSRCFLFAVVISGLLISIWLRNPIIGMVAMIPNILPITVMGSVLYLIGSGLTFASGVALTIAFGIAIDDTVHILNRLRLNAHRDGHITPETVLKSVKQTSPALVITSLVLILGISGNLISEMPPLVLFGGLSIGVFLMALISDILLLPALLIMLTKKIPEHLLRIRT